MAIEAGIIHKFSTGYRIGDTMEYHDSHFGILNATFKRWDNNTVEVRCIYGGRRWTLKEPLERYLIVGYDYKTLLMEGACRKLIKHLSDYYKDHD